MSTPINCRKFLSRTVQSTGVAFAMHSFIDRGALAASGDSVRKVKNGAGSYGDFVPAPSENTGEILLALPAGFRYTAFGRTSAIMSDGIPTPPSHDGMAAFKTQDSGDDDLEDDEVDDDELEDDDEEDDDGNPSNRLITLVRNH